MSEAQSDTPESTPVAKPGKAAGATKTPKVAASPKPSAASAKAAKAAPAKAPVKTPAKAPAKAPAKSEAKAPLDKTAAKPVAEPATKPAAKPAAKPAGTAPAAPAPEPEVAEENPLHKKLRLRPEDTGVIIAPPKDDDNPLLPLPASFLVLDQASGLASSEGQFDYIHVFARDRTDLIEPFPLLRDKLAPGGSLWISWLKQAGRGAGRFDDLNENVIRRLGLTHALVDVKVAALDRHWSALRLVHRKH